MKYDGELELDLENGKIKFISFDNKVSMYILGLEVRLGKQLPDFKGPPKHLIRVTPKTYIGVNK